VGKPAGEDQLPVSVLRAQGVNLKDSTGRDVAVSRGPAGAFAYLMEPMRRRVDVEQALDPTVIVHFRCTLNNISVAGFNPPCPSGRVIEFDLGLAGFLTKPVVV
jgi:hypothetical protein